MTYEDTLKKLERVKEILIRLTNRKEEIENFYQILKFPQRVIKVNIPLKRDKGEIEIFEGYRVQHNNFLGPYKGGIRFFPEVNEDEIKTLALIMTLKCSLVNLPLGGGKGGIKVDPKNLSENELKNLSQEYVKMIFDFIGPERDIPAPDVNTNSQIMDWMTEKYLEITQEKKEKLDKNYLRATFTGKSIQMGGSEGREEATGKGGAIVLNELVKKLNLDRKKLTIAIQGFGNVGYNLAKFLFEEGYKIIALSDSKSGIYSQEEFDPSLVMKCKKTKGMISGCYCIGNFCDSNLGKDITNEDLLKLDVDILIPAALENVITKNNAYQIKAKIILEMANNPITDEADEILNQRGIIVVPDILANAGGVIVSYFEMVQNIEKRRWNKEQIFKKLEEYLVKAFNEVWELSQKEKINLRLASLTNSLYKIFESYLRYY
ncbi:MAG: Glu/Leu/Phe/Val dehydrogenase [Patescibacteria group bacterium]|nr:Glu/Leu/Phe/Val dehydrogenase [Patescibacteria group bacterium]